MAIIEFSAEVQSLIDSTAPEHNISFSRVNPTGPRKFEKLTDVIKTASAHNATVDENLQLRQQVLDLKCLAKCDAVDEFLRLRASEAALVKRARAAEAEVSDLQAKIEQLKFNVYQEQRIAYSTAEKNREWKHEYDSLAAVADVGVHTFKECMADLDKANKCYELCEEKLNQCEQANKEFAEKNTEFAEENYILDKTSRELIHRLHYFELALVLGNSRITQARNMLIKKWGDMSKCPKLDECLTTTPFTPVEIMAGEILAGIDKDTTPNTKEKLTKRLLNGGQKFFIYTKDPKSAAKMRSMMQPDEHKQV